MADPSADSHEQTQAAPSLDETIASAGPVSATTRKSDTLERGTAIGRYVVLAKLGAGGMGVVYAAYDPELDRKVAVKMLLADAGGGSRSTEGRTRLLREAQALAKFSHPEIVAVHDVGEHATGVWIAMEFVDGRTLGGWAEGERRTWREILQVMLSAGRGVAAAHAAGLIHRDLKPDNIMVGHDGRVRVMDFGLTRTAEEQVAPMPARELGARADTGSLATPLTEHGSLLGTPAYMAPEQFAGEGVGPASDQFAFCVTLWELLHGERPFAGRTLVELASGVLDGRVRPPPKDRSVPSWLRRALERGLAREPAARWPTMSALLAELAHGQVRARTRRVGFALVGVVGLAASVQAWRSFDRSERIAACELAGAAIHETWNDEAEAKLRAALVATDISHAPATADKVVPWLDAQASAWQLARTGVCIDANVERGAGWDGETLDRALWCLDERRMEFDALVSELSTGEPRTVEKAVSSVAGLTSVDGCRDVDQLARLPIPPIEARDAVQLVRLDLSRAAALDATGVYAEGLVLARETLARATELNWPPLAAAARLRVGKLLDRSGAYSDAEPMLEAAYFEAAEAGADEVAADAAIALVLTVGIRLARHDEGIVWARHAEVMVSSLVDVSGLRAADRLNQLAGIQLASGSYVEAKLHFDQALEIREAALGGDHPLVAATLNGIGNSEFSLGDYARAKPIYERALAIREQALGPEHPDVASSLNNLANLNQALGDHALARAQFEQALAIWERALGPEHSMVAASLSNLASVHYTTGDYEGAQALDRRALAIREQVFGKQHPEVANSLTNLALATSGSGDNEAAKPLHERALTIYEAALGPDNPEVARCLANLANIYIEAGDFDQAKPLLERSLAIRELLGPDHPQVAVSLVGLVQLGLAQHRAREVLPLAERAVLIRERADASPADLAHARLMLASTLWDAGESRPRAIELATLAREGLRGVDTPTLPSEVETWLAEHVIAVER